MENIVICRNINVSKNWMLSITRPAIEMEVLCYWFFFQVSFFSCLFTFCFLDCRGKLQCIASKCQTLGQQGDYCESDDQCRSNLFCYDRRNSGDGKCIQKKFPGQSCQLNSQCFNSVCMLPQRKKPQRNVRRRR